MIKSITFGGGANKGKAYGRVSGWLLENLDDIQRTKGIKHGDQRIMIEMGKLAYTMLLSEIEHLLIRPTLRKMPGTIFGFPFMVYGPHRMNPSLIEIMEGSEALASLVLTLGEP